jgi:hypothetical protein
MGNVCCSGQDESKKPSALDDCHSHSHTDHDSLNTSTTPTTSNHHNQHGPQSTAAAAGTATPLHTTTSSSSSQQQQQPDPHDSDRQQALRQEQARLELIVQATGRTMVAIRKGNLPYYNDQGFAAALTQHLERTTTFEPLQRKLPDYCYYYNNDNNKEPMEVRLSQEASLLAAGEETFMDATAEAFLDSVLVKKERLFAQVQPIVENLL